MTIIPNLALEKVAKRDRALGTVIDLVLYGTTNVGPLEDAFKLIRYYEDLFTVNREDSELMRVNHAAGLAPVQVSQATYALSKKAVLKSREHFGFNAAIGPLVKLWHIGFADARLPQPEEIQKQLTLINPEDILFNDQDNTIFLSKKGMELDLGGIAKGYIADRVQDFWRSLGFRSGLINLGGNLLLMGQAPHQANWKWRVGLRNPLDKTKKNIAQLIAPACSVVTSGIAERNFKKAGKTYHHILDSQTGYPHENEFASITVLSPHSIDGELASTRLFFADHPQSTSLQGIAAEGAIFVSRNQKIHLIGLSKEDLIITDPDFSFAAE